LGGQNLPFPILKASGLYNSLYYRTSRDTLVTRASILPIVGFPGLSILELGRGTRQTDGQRPAIIL